MLGLCDWQIQRSDRVSCVAGKYSQTVAAESDVCVSCVAGKYSETVGAGSDVCVIQKEHIQALQSRKKPRPDNIRAILKPKPQTNTLAQHFKKNGAENA